MTKFMCNGDWLVEYADGELPASDSALAEQHLAGCSHCSREVASLSRSRQMLAGYFATADGHRPVAQVARRPQSPSGWNAAVMGLASVAAAGLLISLIIYLSREKVDVVRRVPGETPIPVAAPAEHQPEEDVLAIITRETQIARLKATSEILAKEPGMNERHLAMQRYLAQTYGVE